MLELTADDIASLSDGDLHALVARLCESELRSRGISPDCVTSGGNQNAADGGVDVRVSLPPQVDPPGFIPRRDTGFQVKAEDMPASEIAGEMRPKGVLRASIRQLAEQSGAYVIVSSKGSTSDSALQNRREAMAQAIRDLPDPGALKVDFYDRTRLETWLRGHPGTTLWVRERIGKPLQGWSGYGEWSFQPEGAGNDYLVDDQLRFKARGQSAGLSIAVGINQIRATLRSPRGVVRLVGLSGLGKTRLAEASFGPRVGEQSLDPDLAAYTNLSNSPNPIPVALANELIAASRRAVLIIDNCPPDLHQSLSELCRSKGSELSLITIEYDIREDQAEGTEVFSLEAASGGLIEKLVQRRYPNLSQLDARRIAEFSGGNARIAIVLAATVNKNDTVATLSDQELFRRLFEQRHPPDRQLLSAAQAMSLVYSFEAEDISDSAEAELIHLGALVKQDAKEMFKHCAELERRGLAQRRGRWCAVLPPAIANRLAHAALQNISPTALDACFLVAGRERLLKSFSRRLGQLSESAEAQSIAERWLAPGALLADIPDLDELRQTIFDNIAPVAPEKTLGAIERVLLGSEDPEAATACKRYLRMLRLLAWDVKLFDRCVALIVRIAKSANVDNDGDGCRKEFVSLFPLWLSGTHAGIEQRLKITRALLTSADRKERTLGVAALGATLRASHFGGGWDFDFGTRSRDYGYSPKSTDDIARWFRQALHLAEEIACSNGPASTEVREIIASRFRALWSSAGMFDDLERVCREISQTGFWPEGWIAVRQTIHYDSAGFPLEISTRLASLESDLKPTDLVQKVRSIVLSDEVMFCGVDSTVDTGTDVGPTTNQAEKMAHELGRAAVADEEAFAALLPELLTGRTQQLWSFGRGLAEGTEKPRSIWDRLVAQLTATPSNSQRIQVLGGFLNALKVKQPDLADRVLDEAMEDNALGPWYPVLQTAVGIDEAGLGRLMRSLDLGKASIQMYRPLQTGGLTHNLRGGDFNKLLLRIAAEVGGLEIALDILRMRLLFEGRANSSTTELVYIGCELMRRISFTNRRTDVDVYNLAIIAQSCLLGEEGDVAVRAICQNLKQAILKSETYAFYHDEFLKVLLRVQPLSTLDALCGGTRADLESGVQILRQSGQVRGNPFDSISDARLLAWCDQESEGRYPVIAGGVTSFQSSNDAVRFSWTPIARKLLERAPDRVAVAKQFIGRFGPMFWLDSGSALLDELATYPDTSLREFIAGEKTQLQAAAEEQRRVQQLLDQQMSQWRDDERFE
jgi:hypothetical protein